MAKTPPKKSATVARKAAGPKAAAPPKLLSGGNPQIAKGYGDAPVQAYIAAMPGWKRDVGRRLDALIVRTIPGVRKAVKWNTPFYGAPDPDGAADEAADGTPPEEGPRPWFLAFHCFATYLKVTFFRGTSLRPIPPVESKVPEVRYVHLHEGDAFDDAQFAAWVTQAAALPGERL